QLRSHHVGPNRLHFSIAADGRDQVFAHRRHGGNLWCRLAPAQLDPPVRQRSRQQQVKENAISQLSIHVFLFSVSAFCALQAQPRSCWAQFALTCPWFVLAPSGRSNILHSSKGWAAFFIFLVSQQHVLARATQPGCLFPGSDVLLPASRCIPQKRKMPFRRWGMPKALVGLPVSAC